MVLATKRSNVVCSTIPKSQEWWTINCAVNGHKHNKALKNCCHRYNIFIFSFFGNIWRPHIGFFCLSKVMFISFILKLINFFKTKNVKELEHMEYICDKVILVTKHENLHIYFKTKIMGWIFCWMFLWWMTLTLQEIL